MTKRVAIVQSNYIPWKGYFDLIGMVDEFVLLDDVQYTRRDWRNRNRIKTIHGTRWLTIPIRTKGRYTQKIYETAVSDPKWAAEHWRTLESHYSRAPFFDWFREPAARLYEHCDTRSLSEINYQFIRGICDLLGLRARISWSMDYDLVAGKSERLVHLCRQVGATTYLSGPSAQSYINATVFADAEITVEYIDYSCYPEYPQLHLPFEHTVSIVDLLFNVGPNARSYMKSVVQDDQLDR